MSANEILLIVNIIFMLINIAWLGFQASHQSKPNDHAKEPPVLVIYQKASFDFNRVKTIAIERLPANISENGTECTIITYYDNENKYNESLFYCDISNHNKLVQEFNKQKLTGEIKNVETI